MTLEDHDYDLLVVHAEADAGFVRDYLLPALALPRHRVLLVDELPPGGLVVAELDRGVARSRYTLAVLSPAYLADRWADFGEQLATSLATTSRRVIPLRLRDCELPAHLDARIALDFTNRARWAWETARLRELLTGPVHADPPPRYPSPPSRQRRWVLAALYSAALAGSAMCAGEQLRAGPHVPAPPAEMVRFGAAQVAAPASQAEPLQCSLLATSDGLRLHAAGSAAGWQRGSIDTGCDAPTTRASRIAAFELDRREVTNEAFATWLNASSGRWTLAPYAIITTISEPAIPLLRAEKCGDALTISRGRAVVAPEAARWPVICVSWHGANEYCRAQGKRLPLAAEWELAARGAEGRPFPWGTDLPRHDGVAFDLRHGATAHPRVVGDSPQDVSPDGVHDLGGNVAEWVEDGRDDPVTRTLRGGSFASVGPCRLLGSGCRRIPPDRYQKDIGFRCARSVIEAEKVAKP